MGYLTTITLSNDALDVFKKHPKEFAEAIFDGINRANRNQQEESVPFKNYTNYINIQPSRHADDHTLYIHMGNGVVQLNQYDKSFKEMLQRLPEVALSFVKEAERIIKDVKRMFPKLHKKDTP